MSWESRRRAEQRRQDRYRMAVIAGLMLAIVGLYGLAQMELDAAKQRRIDHEHFNDAVMQILADAQQINNLRGACKATAQKEVQP